MNAQHDATGRFLSPTPEAMQRQKTAFLEALALGNVLDDAVQAAGVSYWTIWRRAQDDPDLAAALDHWRKALGLESLAAMQRDMANPDTSKGLQSKGANAYANFRMITAKASFPDMRDSAPIVNVDARSISVNASDLAPVVAQIRHQFDSGQLPEPPADPD